MPAEISPKPTLPPVPRKIRAIRTIAPGEQIVDRSIYCPLLRRSVSLAECSSCDMFAGTASSEVLCATRYRDFAREFATPFERANPRIVPVGELVRDCEVVLVTPELPVEEVARIFVERQLSFVPVIGPSGAVLGVVSKTDLVRERARTDACAGEVMAPLAIRVLETDSLGRAIELMVHHRIHQVPVVTAEDEVVGVLSALDVARWLVGPEGECAP